MRSKYEQYTLQITSALTNTFQSDEEEVQSCFIAELEEVDLTEYFTAAVGALTYVFNKLTGEEKNLIEMTHVLNGLAVQHVVKAAENKTENTKEEK